MLRWLPPPQPTPGATSLAHAGLAAVLPCFVVYLEVARALKHKGARLARWPPGWMNRLPARLPSWR